MKNQTIRIFFIPHQKTNSSYYRITKNHHSKRRKISRKYKTHIKRIKRIKANKKKTTTSTMKKEESQTDLIVSYLFLISSHDPFVLIKSGLNIFLLFPLYETNTRLLSNVRLRDVNSIII